MRLRTAVRRLSLRPFATDDLDDLVAAANDPEVARWLRNRFPRPYTRRDGAVWIAQKGHERPLSGFVIALEDRLVGGIGIDVQDDVYHRSGELGYWLARSSWGRGYATAAVAAVCSYGFDELDLIRIFAHVFEPNEGSRRVLEKCGFLQEGRFRQAIVRGREVHDELVYALVRDDEARR